MSRRSLLLLLASAVLGAMPVVAGSATAGPPATSAIGVEIQAQDLTGVLPNGVVVTIRVKVVAKGDAPSSLVGEGRHFTSSGARSYWPATGFIDGDVVTLGGVVSDSNTRFLVGSPVEVEADSTTGAMTFRLGPQAGGPFVGQTIVFTGVGTVKIKTS
jgi:hypothetical protein